MDIKFENDRVYLYPKKRTDHEPQQIEIMSKIDFDKEVRKYYTNPKSIMTIENQILPDGIKYIQTYKNHINNGIYMILEEPPRKRTIYFDIDSEIIHEMLKRTPVAKPKKYITRLARKYFSNSRLNDGSKKTDKAWKFELFFPYVVYFIKLIRPTDDKFLCYDFRVGFRPSPLKTLDDMIFYPPFPNMQRDFRNCLGSHDEPIFESLTDVWIEIENYWGNIFNDDLREVIEDYMKKETFYGSYFLWDKISEKNSYLIMTEELIPAHKTSHFIDESNMDFLSLDDYLSKVVYSRKTKHCTDLILNSVVYNKYDTFKIGKYEYEILGATYRISNKIKRNIENKTKEKDPLIEKIVEKDSFAFLNYLNKVVITANILEKDRVVEISLTPPVYAEIIKNQRKNYMYEPKVSFFKKGKIVIWPSKNSKILRVEKIRNYEKIKTITLKSEDKEFITLIYNKNIEKIIRPFNKKVFYSYFGSRVRIKSGDEILLTEHYREGIYVASNFFSLNEKKYFDTSSIIELNSGKLQLINNINILNNGFSYGKIFNDYEYSIMPKRYLKNHRYFMRNFNRITCVRSNKNKNENIMYKMSNYNDRWFAFCDGQKLSLVDGFIKDFFIGNDTFIVKKKNDANYIKHLYYFMHGNDMEKDDLDDYQKVNKDIVYKIGDEFVIYPKYNSFSCKVTYFENFNCLKGGMNYPKDKFLYDVNTENFDESFGNFYDINIYTGGNELFKKYFDEEDIKLSEEEIFKNEDLFRPNHKIKRNSKWDVYSRIWKLHSFNVKIEKQHTLHCFFNFVSDDGNYCKVDIMGKHTFSRYEEVLITRIDLNLFSFRKIKREISDGDFKLRINDMIQVREGAFYGYVKNKRYLVKAIIVDDENPNFQSLVLTSNLKTLPLKIVKNFFNVYHKGDRKYNMSMIESPKNDFIHSGQRGDLIPHTNRPININECYNYAIDNFEIDPVTFMSPRLYYKKSRWDVDVKRMNLIGRSLSVENAFLENYENV